MSVCKWMTTRGTLTFCTITVELVPESSIAAKLLSPGFLFFFNNRHPSRGSPGSVFHNRLPHCHQTPAVTVRSWLAEVGGGLVEVWWRCAPQQCGCDISHRGHGSGVTTRRRGISMSGMWVNQLCSALLGGDGWKLCGMIDY